MPGILFTFLFLFAVNAGAQPPFTAGEIMARVAANQDREQKARNQFVYEQKLHRTMRRKDGKLLREEFWTYAMTPSATGTEKKLVSVKGQYLSKGKYLPFDGLPIPEVGHMNISINEDDEHQSRDGLDPDLFPLTSDQQKKYTFTLVGERTIHERTAYQIQFRPIDPHDYGWTGEALIDAEDFQPVTIFTRLSRKLPVGVRTVLGIDVPGLGFNIQYARVEKDLWFPRSYGTEFAIHALHMVNRTFTESMENSGFRRTNVESSIKYPGP